jgi:hypothetical protein
MKPTTIRFADPVYQDLEEASRLTGLPINSIVTVACLEWLRRNVSSGPTQAPRPWRAMQLRRLELQALPLTARPPAPDPLWVFTQTAQGALARAAEAAERTRRPWIGTNHLLQGLAEMPDGRAARALGQLGADAVALVSAEPDEPAEASGQLLPTRQVRAALRRAQEEADRESASRMGTDHLLLGLLLERESRVAEALEAAGATEAAVREALREAPAEE